MGRLPTKTSNNQTHTSMKQITLKDLYEAIKAQIEKGNGDKIVLVADDDEGNGYHPIYYSITEGETFDEEDLGWVNTYGFTPKEVREKCIVIG